MQKKIKPQQSDWAYRSARGQADQLEKLTTPEGIQKREDAFIFFEQFCADPDFLLAANWKAFVKERSAAQYHLNCWMQLLRDLVVLKTQAQKFILNTDQAERLKKFYNLQTQKLLQLAENLVEAEKSLLGNADPTLVFENLWVKYARMD